MQGPSMFILLRCKDHYDQLRPGVYCRAVLKDGGVYKSIGFFYFRLIEKNITNMNKETRYF